MKWIWRGNGHLLVYDMKDSHYLYIKHFTLWTLSLLAGGSTHLGPGIKYWNKDCGIQMYYSQKMGLFGL